MLKQVEFFILINNFFSKPIAIQRLSTQAKNCLCIYITRFCYRSARTITFRNKDGCLFLFFEYGFCIFSGSFIIVMKLTIPEFFIMKIGFFSTLVCQLFYSCQLFSFSFVLLYSFFK